MIAATKALNSAIYTGSVLHQRYLPKHHSFRYRLFMMYLDLDELQAVFAKSWFWSFQRPNIASFKRQDYHRGDSNLSLKEAIVDTVKQQTGLQLSGPVRLLTHLRYFGFVFNPVSFYYCFDHRENLKAIVSEIENTPWGERHAYVHLVPDNSSDQSNKNDIKIDKETAAPYRFTFDKAFHVSPFMPMAMSYDWIFAKPTESLKITMKNYKDSAMHFQAGLLLKRRELTAKNLRTILWRYPAMTAMAVAGIYWQAARLFVKGIPFYNHPDNMRQKNLFSFGRRKHHVTKDAQ